MKRFITLLLPLLLCALAGSAASTSGDILGRCAAKIKSAPSLYVTYTVSADGHSADGQLVIQGDMFTISSPGLRSWYDGKTQWTYSSQIGEVNIITPTPEEVSQINPLAIIKTFSTAYTSQPLKAPAGKTAVRLKAKNPKADITSADITIDDKTLYPTRITLAMTNNQKVTLDIRSVSTGSRLPPDDFRFDSRRFPGVNVVDLR